MLGIQATSLDKKKIKYKADRSQYSIASRNIPNFMIEKSKLLSVSVLVSFRKLLLTVCTIKVFFLFESRKSCVTVVRTGCFSAGLKSL